MKRVYHIVGLGRFGRRAASLLEKLENVEIRLVDLKGRGRSIKADGIDYVLSLLQSEYSHDSIIIPTLPLHLAAKVIQKALDLKNQTWTTMPKLPNVKQTNPNEIVSSIAPALCPMDCPGTKESCIHHIRDKANLIVFMEDLQTNRLPKKSFILESRQIMPGIGGYPLTSLDLLLKKIDSLPEKTTLAITTASPCHGVTSLFFKGRP